MTSQRSVSGIQYGILIVYVIAMAFLVWSFISGIQLAVESSVIGGLAVMLIAAIMLVLAGWRLKFRWSQLRESAP